MIDTLSFTIDGRLRPDIAHLSELPNEWTVETRTTSQTNRTHETIALKCDAIDLMLFGRNDAFIAVRANLPKILWGHNGRLIKTEDELKVALQWLQWILTTVIIPNWPNDGFIPGMSPMTAACHFTRIDLAWHFSMESGVFAALTRARHQKIRSSPSLIKGQTVHLKGTLLEIIAYDKVEQMRLRKQFKHHIHRVEFRVKNKGLSQLYTLPDGDGYSRITFDWCKYVMGKIAEETETDIVQCAGKTVEQYVADVEADYPLIPVLERYIQTRGLCRESERKFRKKVQRIVRAKSELRSFADFFSGDNWPAPLEIEMPEEEAKHRRWLENYAEEVKHRFGRSAKTTAVAS